MTNQETLNTIMSFLNQQFEDIKGYYDPIVWRLSHAGMIPFKKRGVLPVVTFHFGYFKGDYPRTGTVMLTKMEDKFMMLRVKRGKNNPYCDFEEFSPIDLKNFIDHGGVESDFFVAEELGNKPLPIEDL